MLPALNKQEGPAFPLNTAPVPPEFGGVGNGAYLELLFHFCFPLLKEEALGAHLSPPSSETSPSTPLPSGGAPSFPGFDLLTEGC